MNEKLSASPTLALSRPTRVRYGVLGFACTLSMITYLDRVCFGTVAPYIQQEFGLSNSEKGMLFSAFALAYAIFEVPSGWLGVRDVLIASRGRSVPSRVTPNEYTLLVFDAATNSRAMLSVLLSSVGGA